MTANGPNRPPLTRRAARPNDEAVSRAAATDDALPPWVTDAAAGPSADAAVPADDAAEPEEPSTPRRARSTFTTERRRPRSTNKPLPPLEPLIPDVDLTEPASRERPAPIDQPMRARSAVTPTREPDAPFVTGEVPVAASSVAETSNTVLPATVELVEILTPVWAPPSAPVEIVVPPRPPLPEDSVDPPVEERPTRRQRRALALSAAVAGNTTAPDAADAPPPEPDAADAPTEPEQVPVAEPAPEAPTAAAARPTRRTSRAAGPASAPTPTQSAEGPPDALDPETDTSPDAAGDSTHALESLDDAPEDPLPQHAQTRRSTRFRTGLGLIAAAVIVMGSTVAVTAAVTGDPVAEASVAQTLVHERDVESEASVAVPLPAPAESIPAPEVTAAAAFVDVCSDPEFTAAIAAGDDTTAIALAGGGVPFRAAVASGNAPCVPLGDPRLVWVVVNKLRPYEPIDYSPPDLVVPVGVRDLAGSPLRADAGTALAAMISAAAGAGAGEVALSSGFRSYGVQRSTYASQVNARGTEGADLVSARPGYSEHQSGLAADVVACADGGCGGLDTFAGTTQAAWVAEHAWEFGWVVRYEEGATGVSGYSPEPWHLRFLGPELAAAYHAGGFHTVEEFLGLPAAPQYAD